jgi:hypothetical protein
MLDFFQGASLSGFDDRHPRSRLALALVPGQSGYEFLPCQMRFLPHLPEGMTAVADRPN